MISTHPSVGNMLATDQNTLIVPAPNLRLKRTTLQSEYAAWLTAPDESRDYDSGRGSGDSLQREASYRAGFVGQVESIFQLSTSAESVAVFRRTLRQAERRAHLERFRARQLAGTGRHFFLFSESEQIEARRLRARHQAAAFANAAFQSTGADLVVFRLVLDRWLIVLRAWEQALDFGGDVNQCPPCVFPIADAVRAESEVA